MRWHLKSPASWLFTQPFIQGAKKHHHAWLAFVRGIIPISVQSYLQMTALSYSDTLNTKNMHTDCLCFIAVWWWSFLLTFLRVISLILAFFLIFGKIDFNITQWLYLISVNNHDICIQTQFICHFCSHCMSVWLRLVMSYTSDSYLHPTLQADVMIIILFIYSSSWDIARALCVTLGCMSIMSIDSQMGLYYSKVLSNNDKICDTMHREWCCRKEGDTRKTVDNISKA